MASKKPSSPTPTGRRTPSTDAQTSPGRPRKVSSQSPGAATNGVGRSPSTKGSPGPVSARAAAARRAGLGRSNLSMSSVPRHYPHNNEDEEARAASTALIEDLKDQVQKAETVADQYRKQLGLLQMRLDEAVSEQTRLEEQAHEKDGQINPLRDEIKELHRQIRDLEQKHETERESMMADKENQAKREEELEASIQRLKETIAQKDLRMGVDGERNLSRSPSFRNRSSPDIENGQFAPSSSQLQRSPSRNNSKLILQKDKLIESLRLELAEAQIKIVEMENLGGGRQQELERELLEARMANARLMEDNESYQLLLSERTLNGDFTKGDFMHEAHPPANANGTGGSSLADELDSVGEGGEDNEKRKLESELKSYKDQNKALSLYIERIIGRLLQHEGFEHILDKSDADNTGPKGGNKDKELPPPPPAEKDEAPEQQQSFLQQAKSVVSGQPARSNNRQRPPSQLTQSTSTHSPPQSSPPEPPTPSAHENPDTAPRIPLGRSRTVQHRRTRSDQLDNAGAAAGTASVISQMYRGPPSGRSPSTGPLSPGISPTLSNNGPFFAPGAASKRSSVATAPGGTGTSISTRSADRRFSGAASLTSERSGDVGSMEGGAASASPPRSGPGMNNYTGAVMQQNKLRPLRLVQENQEMDADTLADEAARKKANRGSWAGWFNRGSFTMSDSSNSRPSS
ncbi:hypothetical protein H112_05564 [Trichophyton rubrum D6]|uniref:M protein, serotype 2.1 n=1 Tax=Trichophyton rubrum (strain ATCC MYA-4607 / CBS 118892) TaxID=559305 RepID=F2SJU1_TRIRC|nr:uncharacterized protein TERG_03298 [Trichophyton rubrum CBS 118892]EZF40236.1 hypothetical protein H102_05549 [Trichophyton rubrum CBS 100081]EZF61461.1 hypothetical protein H104_05563 [Trichophyton rubrum CBS 289.86]EZF93421.1 hypothetical protein H113_05619 [Trichophyton rubrum MR1459]EZG15045.1 hypothetical protein H107_05713 [Trichophyton rubrum CBS 202.88]KDB31965.1 hypothetical protein H112_05564 [Trichophyton rubrum D6]KMQ49067.1 hypothetical protein HL42_0203 [Trichophyton rubrum]